MAVFYPKNLERVVRDLVKNKCDHEYIRHYMMEEYQVGLDVIDAIFAALGIATEEMSVTDQKRKKHKDKMKGFTRF